MEGEAFQLFLAHVYHLDFVQSQKSLAGFSDAFCFLDRVWRRGTAGLGRRQPQGAAFHRVPPPHCPSTSLKAHVV